MNPRPPSWLDSIPSLSEDPTHPAQISLRTYVLSLSLSLGPSLIPFITSFVSSAKYPGLKRVLRRELGIDGFAFAVTLSVGGGAAIRHLWRALDEKDNNSRGSGSRVACDIWRRLRCWIIALNLSQAQKTFLSYMLSSSVGILLLQAGRDRSYRLRRRPKPATAVLDCDRPSPTLDLTLLLLVRAVDAAIQAFVLGQAKRAHTSAHQSRDTSLNSRLVGDELLKEKKRPGLNKERQTLTSRIDALVFWACSARIMWCFFYEPERLPRSYVTWINTLASADPRLLSALQLIRQDCWSYIKGSPSHSHILKTYSKDLGYPSSWGDPSALPSYGGATANVAWRALGVKNRSSVGGLPCELVHGGVGSSLGLEGSCAANSGTRGLKAFVEAIAIYLPAHFLPILLTRPQTLLRPHRALATLLGALRSATFLSTFVGSFWFSICVTRTLLFARLFPFVSHDFWDGPFGCVLAGCLVCGNSIWIENGRRRGEMALYVLPRAVRACLPDRWVKSGNRGVRIAERITFILSISSLLTAATHHPESLRGLSRWTLAFVTNGPNAGFWKRKQRNPSAPPTPSIPLTPVGNDI